MLLSVGSWSVVEVVATAETKCEISMRNVIFRAPALLAPSRLHYLVPRHRFATASVHPEGLHEPEEPRIRLLPRLTDVFPLRSVIKAPAVRTLTVGMPLTRKIVMVHNNPPFWPPVFLGADYTIYKSIKRSIARSKTKNQHSC
jgi:hypothetical protein